MARKLRWAGVTEAAIVAAYLARMELFETKPATTWDEYVARGVADKVNAQSRSGSHGCGGQDTCAVRQVAGRASSVHSNSCAPLEVSVFSLGIRASQHVDLAGEDLSLPRFTTKTHTNKPGQLSHVTKTET
ncbi:hypothetical protein VUR80DRAFT_9170 [Thermomyces stellatus]